MAAVTIHPKPTTRRPSTTIEAFLDVAGHELRIPITSLKGQLQLMQRRWQRTGADPADAVALDKILYHTERLNYSLQVFLDAAHIAQGRMQLLPAEYDYDLTDILRHLIRTYAAGNPTRRITLALPPDLQALEGNWDRLRIETVLSVLLTNALRYGPERGEILVRLACSDALARIEVLDRGIGVPPADHSRIFAGYTHASNAESAGVGLGLYVARAIVRHHGGRIGVRARRGGGSIFWFTLPRRRLATLAEHVQQRRTTRARRTAGGRTP